MSKNTINQIKVSDKKLTIDQKGSLINRVVNSCFNGSDLHIEMLEPIFAITVMQMLTDKEPITTKTTIDDKEVDVIDYNATYEMIENEDIMSEIKNVIEHKYLNYIEDLHSDVVESLEYKKAQKIAETSSVSDKVVNGIVGVLDAIHSAVENMDMGKSKEILDFVSKMGGTKQSDFVDSIVKNLPKKETNISPIEG